MIISVFGKNGSGKTTISTHLAKYLSMQNKFVAVISLETRYGSLQRSLGIKVPEEKSMINALSQEDIKQYFTKYNDNMYILSLSDVDDITKYDAINNLTKDEKILTEFILKIRDLFDYVIVDVTERIIDNFTFFMIKNSDKLINIIESRPETLSFALSHKEILSTLIQEKNIINLLNKHDESVINLSTIQNTYGNIDININFDLNVIKNERENILNKHLISNMSNIYKLVNDTYINNNLEEQKQGLLNKILRR